MEDVPRNSGAHPVALDWFPRRGRGPHAILALFDQGLPMFEFACERIIPGCVYTERDVTKEKLLEQAMDHLRERHNMDYIDKPLQERLLSVGIVPVK